MDLASFARHRYLSARRRHLIGLLVLVRLQHIFVGCLELVIDGSLYGKINLNGIKMLWTVHICVYRCIIAHHC